MIVIADISDLIILYKLSSIVVIYVANSSATAAKVKATAIAKRGGVHAARPKPIDKCDQAGIGDAEFLPRCIAAGCSPIIYNIVNN